MRGGGQHFLPDQIVGLPFPIPSGLRTEMKLIGLPALGTTHRLMRINNGGRSTDCGLDVTDRKAGVGGGAGNGSVDVSALIPH